MNSKHWVYLGELSNAAWRVRITDSATGAKRTCQNPAGKRQSLADRTAF